MSTTEIDVDLYSLLLGRFVWATVMWFMLLFVCVWFFKGRV